MQTSLWAHPAFGNLGLDNIDVSVERPSPTLVRLRYIVTGDMARIIVPPPAAPLRTDGLWESTCFEMFLRREGEDGYLELNFAPSGEWAAYAFSGYRKGMVQGAMPAPPDIRTSLATDRLEVEVAVSPWLDLALYRMNLAAVIQSRTGERSFWAANHAGGEPDFHHPSCFIDQLPPAPAP
jgi:hypothetical protein